MAEEIDGNPPKIELMADWEHSPYVLKQAAEIGFTLKTLQQKRQPLTAYYDEAEQFTLTAILDVDLERTRLVFDPPKNPALAQALADAHKVVLISSLNQVKIQFATPALTWIEFDGHPALSAPIPNKLLKLQRRDFYRLTLPTQKGLRCSIKVADGSWVEVGVVDISLGGIGIIGYSPEIEFAPGISFHDCKIDLPGTGTIMVGIEIRNTFDVTLRDGLRTRRSGCQFTRLSGTMQTTLQKYINRVEREQLALKASWGDS